MAIQLPAQNDIMDMTSTSTGRPLLKQASTWLYLLLGGTITTFIWMGLRPAPDPMTGGILTGLLWLLILIGVFGRAQAHRLSRELDAARAFENAVVAHRSNSDGVSRLPAVRLRHVSAWLVFMLGLAATGVLWQFELFQSVLGDRALFIVGASVAGMFALTVAANAVNRLKTRRIVREFRDARKSEQTTIDIMRALDVMITASLPTGERTEFNDRLLEFLDRNFEDLKGHGWLEIVHPDDREDVLEAVRRPLAPNESCRTLDYCVQHRHGKYLWVRETLTPRFDKAGRLVEFIGAVVDITNQVNNETALDEQVTTLRDDLTSTRDELSKAKTSRNRFQKNLEEAREEIKNLTETANAAEARIADAEREAKAKVEKIRQDTEARIEKLDREAKSIRAEQKATSDENKKLTGAFEKMKEEIAELHKREGDFRKQIAQHIKETREANADAADARKKEAQQRAKSNRLTRRCEELETQLSEKTDDLLLIEADHEEALAERDAKLNEARADIERLGTEMVEQAERITREAAPTELAGELRRQLDGMAKMTRTLLGASLQGPHQDAINNAAAAVRTMTELVDQALGRDALPLKVKRTTGTSFDLRQTMQGVSEFLHDDAEQRGVAIEIDIASTVPALVNGDDVALRSALMSLTASALNLIEDGTLTLKLTEDMSTDAHATIRCEFTHANAKVKADAVESMLALNATDDDMPNAVKRPIQHRAAQAWSIIRQLDGSHGFMLPDNGGFSVWCTFNLGRVAAAAQMKSSPTTDPPAASGITSTSQAPMPASTAMPVYAPPPKPIPASVMYAAGENADPKSMPRLPQEFLECNLGDVVELGVGGMRVHSPKAQKQHELTVIIDDLELRATVDWSKKISGRKHDVGLFFLYPTEHQKKRLLAITMKHRRVSTMLDLD